jgi:large subunit ribosomal protein L29
MSNIQELRALTPEELQKQVESARKELLELRMKNALRQLDNTAQIRALRHRIAQMMTVLNEKRRANATAAAQ